ncbi:hypothetical protein GN956_G20363 [Arapaima gigas]
MTIGKSSRKSAKSPKILDRASGFYGRLDETNIETAKEEMRTEQNPDREARGNGDRKGQLSWEPGIFHFDGGMMEDDGAALLLRRKPSRSSSRWRRRRGSSSRKQAGGPSEDLPAGKENQTWAPATDVLPPPSADEDRQAKPVPIHFSIKDEGDDQALIRRKKEGKELDVQQGEHMKVVKRNSLRHYRQAINRAFRRGWDTFIANMNSVTLTPISSSSSRSSSTLAEYR